MIPRNRLDVHVVSCDGKPPTNAIVSPGGGSGGSFGGIEYDLARAIRESKMAAGIVDGEDLALNAALAASLAEANGGNPVVEAKRQLARDFASQPVQPMKKITPKKNRHLQITGTLNRSIKQPLEGWTDGSID